MIYGGEENSMLPIYFLAIYGLFWSEMTLGKTHFFSAISISIPYVINDG